MDSPTAAIAFQAAQRIAETFHGRYRDHLASLRRVTPQLANRASNLDDPCERRLYLRRVAWEKAAPPSETLQSIFEVGKQREGHVLSLLNELGLRVYGEQTTRHWEALELSGSIEGTQRAEVDGVEVAVVAEVKTLNPWDFDRIVEAGDLVRRGRFLRKWYGQIQLYMLLTGHEAAVLYIENKVTGEKKAIPVALDFPYAEALIRKAQRVNAAVADRTPPDYPEDRGECEDCPFYGRACNPPVEHDAATLISDATLVEATREYIDTAGAAARHRAAAETLRAALGHRALSVVAGAGVVSFTEYETTVYDVPQDVKEAHRRVETRRRMRVDPLVSESQAA